MDLVVNKSEKSSMQHRRIEIAMSSFDKFKVEYCEAKCKGKPTPKFKVPTPTLEDCICEIRHVHETVFKKIFISA